MLEIDNGALPQLNNLNIDGSTAKEVVGNYRQQQEQCSNPQLTPRWGEKICFIGTGAYSTAIGDRLSRGGRDVMLLGRDPKVAAEINLQQGNSKNLPGRTLSSKLRAETNPALAMLDRGIIIIAVPTNTWSQVLSQYRPHPDSIVITMAKGMISEGWDPTASSTGLRDGPPKDCKISLPHQYLANHPAWSACSNVCSVSGPGFANDIASGEIFNLAIASKRREVVEKVAEIFRIPNLFLSLNDDPVGTEMAGAMKNVIAILVGVVDGLRERYGRELYPSNLTELVKQFGMQETGDLAKGYSRGKYRSLLGPAGYPDLNLTTSSTVGRNYALGLDLATGRSIENIVTNTKRVTEGAWSAWAAKRLADDRGDKPGIYCPITNTVVDIFRGKRVEEAIENLIDQLRERNSYTVQRWTSGVGRQSSTTP